jgi:hypothetical protein
VTPDVLCTYPAGSFGELAGNLTGLLATQAGNTTPFTLESDSAPEFYVTGNPAASSTTVRTLERDVASLTANNPYTGGVQHITNYLADPTEEGILHMVNADPARTPTFAMFARPDYFLSAGAANCTLSCVSQNPAFAYNHGDYAAEIDTDWAGFAGPGVANIGLDGSAANAGPNSAGPDSGQVTVPDSGTTGTWMDETDLRPTLMYLTGLQDDYEHDGRVVSEILTSPNSALTGRKMEDLGACYKQLNSSVGQFGTDTLRAATQAIESTSSSDLAYLSTASTLAGLGSARDKKASAIKEKLGAAAFHNAPVPNANGLLNSCEALLQQANTLAH